MKKQGYLTIATGSEKFLDYAINLRLSCIYNDPNRPFALITDEKIMKKIHEREINHYFDQIIMYKGNYTGLLVKLDLYQLSPFDETFFIDADSLMIKDPNPAWELVVGKHFVVQGRVDHFERWTGHTEKEIKDMFGISYVPRFNGGFYYFNKSEKAVQVFKKANELVGEFKRIGFYLVHGFPDEEPIISVAIALCGLKPVPDSSNIMFSPIGRGFWFKLSIPKRKISFKKYGIPVSPIILHCCADLCDSRHYRKAVRQLHKIAGKKLNGIKQYA